MKISKTKLERLLANKRAALAREELKSLQESHRQRLKHLAYMVERNREELEQAKKALAKAKREDKAPDINDASKSLQDWIGGSRWDCNRRAQSYQAMGSLLTVLALTSETEVPVNKHQSLFKILFENGVL